MSHFDPSEPEIKAELREIVTELLDGLIDTGLLAGSLPQVVGHDGVTIESSVPIIGGQAPARLVVRVPATTGVALATSFLDEGDEVGTDQACEALAELTNMLGGTAKSLIDDETALDVPSAGAIPTDALTPLANSVSVNHQLGTFDVQLEA